MRSRGLSVALSGALFLQGCATYSFAPPKVDLRHVTRDHVSANLRCGIGLTDKQTKIRRGIKGAEHLTDNFLYAYRCAARQVANGRQHFEVPAMLIGLGGAVAAAAGAPAAVAIGTGAAVAGLNSGKGYYAPKDKLPILAASVDALVCVKTESLGIDAYGSTLITAATGTKDPDGTQADGGAGQGASKDDGDDTQQSAQDAAGVTAAQSASPIGNQIAISATKRYFEMVEAALLDIENIAAQRLSSVGSYSPDAIVTEFNALQQKQADADAKDKTKKAEAAAQSASVVTAATGSGAGTIDVQQVSIAGAAAPVTEQKGALDSLTLSGHIDMVQGLTGDLAKPGSVLAVAAGKPTVVSLPASQSAVTEALLTISQLQLKLDKCVLRAKL